MTLPMPASAPTLAALARECGGRSPSTAELIARILREAIVRGTLAEGAPIRQDHVAAELGISKIPLREALSKLEGQGLVTMLPRRGAVVATVSADKIEDIYQTRLALEPQVLGSAIPRQTRTDLAEAERLIGEMDAQATEQLGRLNWQFHMALIDRSRLSNLEHRRILDACRNGDVAAAQQLLRDHLDGIRRVMAEYFSRPQAAPAADPAA